MRVYLSLHDSPPGAANGAGDEAAMAGMSAEERKKYKLAKKKEVGAAWACGGVRLGMVTCVILCDNVG